MGLVVKDRVIETSTSTGTSDFTLAGAITGFRTFASVCSTGDTCYYMIEAIDGSGYPTGDWESGFGTYSAANTLTRTTVNASSNSNAAVSFSSGAKRVSISMIASSVSKSWVLAGSWTWSTNVANVDFAGLSGYNDLLVVARNITHSVSSIVSLQVSVDNGSTFFSGASDYVAVAAAGSESTATLVGIHTTAATTARSAVAMLSATNVTSAVKVIDRVSRDDAGSALFVGSSTPINAVRFLPSAGGNFTGGSIYVFGR